MKELIESIYFVPSSEKLLLEHGQNANQSTIKNLQDLVLLRLNKSLLKDVEYLQYCLSLKICILSNNCIVNINPLKSCSRLVKLDLHGNQIQLLPGKEFWSEMSDLRLLYLHNNGIGKLTNVQSLSVCSNLIGLTLFDTPLSLNKNYRHIIVNSISSLKVLDNYVISDEEIIEGWSLNGKFKTLSPFLFLNFLPVIKETSYQDEINMVRDIISKIHQILAHHSPVLIIQSRIRGYLTRKRLGKVSPHKMQKWKKWVDYAKEQIYNPRMIWLDGRRLMNYIVKTEQEGEDMKPSLMKKIEDNKNSVKEISDFSFDNQRQEVCCILLNPRREKVKKQQKKQSHLISKDVTHLMEADFKEKKMEFRLPVFKAIVHEADPVRNMLLSNQSIGKDIRLAIQQYHSIIQNTPKPKVKYQAPFNLESRIHAKMHDSPRFLPFYTVDKAYKVREAYESQAKKVHQVKQMYSEKIKAKQQIENFLKNKSNEYLKKQEDDGVQLQETLHRFQLNKLKEIKKAKQRHAVFVNGKKERTAENALAQKFNSHRNSITNALLKYDRLMMHENDKERKHTALKKEKIFCYVAPRQLLLQTENAATSLVLQKTRDKLLQARVQIATVKMHKASVEPLCIVPVIQTVT